MAYSTAVWPFARFDGSDDPSFEYISGAGPQDGLGAAGFYPQNSPTMDMAAGMERDTSGNLVFKDTVSGTKTLTELSDKGITASAHKGLRQLIHLADGGGPFEGFTSGAYRETTGTVFPSAIVWWESAAKLVKVVEKLITWTGPFPTTVVWKAYDALGLLVTVTDTISYSGPFETSRTRAVTPEDVGVPAYFEPVAELPTPAAPLRGRLYELLGASGEDDKYFICRKLADDTYTHQAIAFA